MPTAYASEPVRSLAAADTGEAIQIRRILFGALRALCADLGLREGEIVRCRAGTPSQLMLETPTGRVVALERDWARFIQVSTAAAHAQAAGLRAEAASA
ncbi:MAG TPA: FeoA domain-containing protein [Longimicrobiales bacterium]|nr:FeoA domain-containing protein [Longimicrobiales bacterium]